MKVLVTTPRGTPELYRPLTDAGHEIVYGRPFEGGHARRYTDEELIELCRGVDAVITGALSRRVLEASPSLQAVVAPTVGYERIDVDAATELGVLVCNSPSLENIVGVAESAIGLIIALSKRLRHNEVLLRRGDWTTDADRGALLWEKTIGIIGLGRIGSRVAKRLAGWDVRIIACDPYATPETAGSLGVTLVDLPALLKESDFITVHVAVTAETRGMIDAAALRQMKPSAFLVNMSRGEVVDEAALVQAIAERWIAGAALDVFQTEPLPRESLLRDLDPERVILTPHNLSHSMASLEGNLRLALESTLAILRGKMPDTTVNPDAIPRRRARLQALALSPIPPQVR